MTRIIVMGLATIIAIAFTSMWTGWSVHWASYAVAAMASLAAWGVLLRYSSKSLLFALLVLVAGAVLCHFVTDAFSWVWALGIALAVANGTLVIEGRR